MYKKTHVLLVLRCILCKTLMLFNRCYINFYFLCPSYILFPQLTHFPGMKPLYKKVGILESSLSLGSHGWPCPGSTEARLPCCVPVNGAGLRQSWGMARLLLPVCLLELQAPPAVCQRPPVPVFPSLYQLQKLCKKSTLSNPFYLWLLTDWILMKTQWQWNVISNRIWSLLIVDLKASSLFK